MPETVPSYQELPILRELRDDLAAAFRAQETAARPQPRKRRGRWLIDGLGLALGLSTAAAVALVFLADLGHRAPGSATLQRTLNEAAGAAERHPIPFPRDDQFFYVRSISTHLSPIGRGAATPLRIGQSPGPEALVTTEQQTWSSTTRTGLVETRVLSFSFPTVAARHRWERLGRPPFVPPDMRKVELGYLTGGKYLFGNIELTREQLLTFPTQPSIIYRRLYAAGGSAKEVLTEITDTLRLPVPARLRAALYRTLALVPGVHYLGRVVDRMGRAGTAVVMVDGGGVQEFVIDPRTGDLLDEGTLLVDAKQFDVLGVANGPVSLDTAYVRWAVTDSLTVPTTDHGE